jgi:hypothetical protein
MSDIPMTSFERAQRSLARTHGTLTRQYVTLAISWNRISWNPTGGGDRFIDAAYEEARVAARHADRAIDAQERRERPRRRRHGEGA